MSAGPDGPGGPGSTTPGSMLEVYMHALASRTHDDFLDQVNLGIGNYSESEYWQQIQAFRDGMFADSSMTRKLLERARYETKIALVEAIFDNPESEVLRGVDAPHKKDGNDKYPKTRREEPPDGDSELVDRHEYFDEYADEMWDSLGYTTQDGERYKREEHQANLINTVTGIGMNWVPPHWRMLKARHEASRSKDAHLIDNLFGRPPEPKQVAPPDSMEEF